MGELSLETFLFAVLNFVLLVAGLSYLLFKPVRGMLAKRRQHIQSELDSIEDQRQKAAEQRREAETILDDARAQAFELIEQARAEGERIRQEKLAETKKELARLAERNRAELQHARDRVVDEVRQEVVALVMAVAGKVLGESMDPAAHRRFIESFLQGLAEREATGERWMP
ncbi:MAG: F0F1 ATP synthase subunit B [Patescibacteria group bacterium]